MTIGATSSIDAEITHLASDSVLGIAISLPLAWLIRSPLDMECSSNHQEFFYIQGDQSLSLILYFLFISSFFNSLNFFYFSNAEGPSVRIISLEVPITMAFETLFNRQSFWLFASNPFTLIKNFDGCRGSYTFVIGSVTLGVLE